MDLSKLNDSEIVDYIKGKRQELDAAGKKLKTHFVGLDNIIDKILRDIETWYIMPELMTRPVIICLWGPTGVGKTDLVRRLVKLLSFSDRYCEIELKTGQGNTHHYNSNISSLLGANDNISSGEPSVILLDEIQNFRTLDESGDEIGDYSYRDTWQLLSDGKLPCSTDTDYLLQLLWEYKPKNAKVPEPEDPFENDGDDGDIEDEEPDSIKKRVKNTSALSAAFPEDEEELSYYSLKHFKNVLRLDESVEEIATWSNAKKRQIILSKIGNHDIYQEEDYTKSLIFISGNLDEVYSFATDPEEVDVDADIFHDLSSKITLLDVKRELTHRFKPEQIARFGNNQIIYKALSKKSYRHIIRRKLAEIRSNIRKRFGVKLKIDSSINRLIYDNGVFPTQGTRPVFSTISEIVESSLPTFLMQMFIKKKRELKLFYKEDHLCVDLDGHILKSPYSGVLDTIRRQPGREMDKRVAVSIHEAGHAVVYGLLFKTAPAQITAFTTSADKQGFIFGHSVFESRQTFIDKICVQLAAAAAERIVFGVDQQTTGNNSDLREATMLAGRMIQYHGMSTFYSYIGSENRQETVNNDLDSANPVIEKVIGEQTERASNLIKDNIEILTSLADRLIAKGRVEPEEFKSICKKHGVDVDVKEFKEVLSGSYSHMYEDFKSRS